MKQLLLGALALACCCGSPAAAEEPAGELQVQFQQWAYKGNGVAELMVALRNPTPKAFATAVWDCEFYDKEKYIVGRSTLIFHVIPSGALVVETQVVSTNGMFQDGNCQLAGTEEVTKQNERLYRPSSRQVNLGLASPAAQRFFHLDRPIQGRAAVK